MNGYDGDGELMVKRHGAILILGALFLGTDTGVVKADQASDARRRYLELGRRLFHSDRPPMSTVGRSCFSCHSPARDLPLEGVHDRYPFYDREADRFRTLSATIRACLSRRQDADLDLLGREEIVALQVHIRHALTRGRKATRRSGTGAIGSPASPRRAPRAGSGPSR